MKTNAYGDAVFGKGEGEDYNPSKPRPQGIFSNMTSTFPLSNLRPATFSDWFRLWQRSCTLIKEMVFLPTGVFRKVRMDRTLWKELHRCERIYRRLQIERDRRGI